MKQIRLWLLACCSISLVACASPPERPTMVEHVVFVWLKDKGNPDHVAALIDASQSFTVIPGVLAVETGGPLPSDRPVVDATYDLAIRMRFDSAGALQDYATHPLHVEKRDQVLIPLVERIQVYDFSIDRY